MILNTTGIKNPETKQWKWQQLLLSNSPVFFVWGIWAIMLVILFACIFIYGRNIPMAEDWNMVAPLTGHEPSLVKWLWFQNNEHRIPLPKIILLFLLKITNGDFRIGMVLTVLCMGLLTAYFIRVFYKIRGERTSYTDAFFPLLLLHLGNWENFFWSWQFTFVLSILLICILISIVIQYKSLLNIKQAIIAAICMIGLPLCGANGLLYVLPVIPLLALEGYFHFRSKEREASRQIGFILFAAIGITIASMVFYFVGYQRPAQYLPSPGIADTLKTGIKFMELGFGEAVLARWKISGFLTLTLMLCTGALLIFTVTKSRGPEFRRAIGLFFLLGGSVIFALAVGYGRATQIPLYGLPMRYVLLSAPALIICYSSWQLYGQYALQKSIQWGMFIAVVLLLIPNTRKGFAWRNYYIGGADSVLRDINNGVPRSRLATQHLQFLLHWNRPMLLDGLEQLKQAGMGPLKNMKEDSLKTH